MHQQLAKVALELIAQVRGPYDDQNLNAVLQTKRMLQQIAAGQLLVVPPKPKKVKEPQGAT
jgi:hypothetical protein